MIRMLAGLVLVFVTWAAVRRAVGTHWFGQSAAGRWTLPLDALPPFVGFGLFLWPTARPILAGLIIAALGFGLIITDREKRRILGEPVLFSDRAELIEVARHPRLYLAFIGLGAAIAIFVGILLAIGAIFWLEPPLWPVSTAAFAVRAVLAVIVGRLCFVLPALAARPLARLYARAQPSGDPDIDMRRLGPFATFLIHATTATAERPARRARAAAGPLAPLPAGQGPIIVVQAESFVDASLLDPTLADRLPHYAGLRDGGALSGRLDVPCWGANTIRTELAVLAGIDGDTLGLDRFNPYEHFARVPLPTLASAARAGGYRTVFVHPYDRDFYARHKVIPALGFDAFHGIEAFAGAPRDAGYVSDAAVADFVLALLEREGPDVLVYIVTMENHGPWTAKHDPLPPAPLPDAWRALADADAAGRWLRHLTATDAMIGRLRANIAMRGRGWLMVFGDHQPSLVSPFQKIDVGDQRTDYAIWSPHQPDVHARDDIAAHEIASRFAALIRGMPNR